eukprot:241190-Prymnesium_polylepis.1
MIQAARLRARVAPDAAPTSDDERSSVKIREGFESATHSEVRTNARARPQRSSRALPYRRSPRVSWRGTARYLPTRLGQGGLSKQPAGWLLSPHWLQGLPSRRVAQTGRGLRKPWASAPQRRNAAFPQKGALFDVPYGL